LAVVMALVLGGVARGQASALPSAQAGPEPQTAAGEASQGRKLLDQMVAALGGEAWLHREDWIFYGRSASFYKGQPHESVPAFEEYYRTHPFGERVIAISHFSTIPGMPGKDHRDIADVWTPDNGYEVTYKGTQPLPAKDVAEYQRRRRHSLETVVEEWLKQPGVLVTYEGTNMVERRLADQVSILTANNDAVTLELDESTHLPLSLSYQWLDPVYKDLNKDVEQFDDYHVVQGIQTPYSITRLHNGDMVMQRFLTKAVYNTKLAPDLFDPERKLEKKTK
jgi:hypothetical protein